MPGRPRRQHTSFSRTGGQGTAWRGPAPRQRGSAAPRGSSARTRLPARRPDPHAALDQALAAAAAVPQPDAATFAELGLPRRWSPRWPRSGITEPFAIQARALPDALAGRDVLGRAQTGSGKTLAFGLPMLARLAGRPAAAPPARRPRGLVLVPTRELARQVADALAPLGHALGLQRHDRVRRRRRSAARSTALRRGVDIVVATPGRLIDLIERGACTSTQIEITVLDEADHMADLGFLPAVTRILDATPAGGQRLLFSATLDRGVDQLVTALPHRPGDPRGRPGRRRRRQDGPPRLLVLARRTRCRSPPRSPPRPAAR